MRQICQINEVSHNCKICHLSANEMLAKFTYEQYATINQSNAGCFDPRVFVNCNEMLLRNCCQMLLHAMIYSWLTLFNSMSHQSWLMKPKSSIILSFQRL